MKIKMLALLSALCVAGVLAVGCAPSHGGANIGSEGTVEYEGGTVTVTLESNPSTGYQWVDSVDGDCLELVSSEFVEGEKNVAGASGSQVFVYEAIDSGEARITFAYERSWEKTDEDKSVSVTVSVGAGKKIQDVTVKA